MEFDQLVSAKRQRGVRASFVITELDFVHTRCKPLDNSAYLSPLKRNRIKHKLQKQKRASA